MTTDLIDAAKGGHADTVKILLDNGADPFMCDDLDHDAWWYAHRNGHSTIVEMLEAHEDMLFAKEAAENAKIVAENYGVDNVSDRVVRMAAMFAKTKYHYVAGRYE